MMKHIIASLIAICIANTATAQWVPLNSGIAQTLNSVCCTDENTVYAVGDSGLILKTSDGGTDWVRQSSGMTDNLYSVFFTNGNTGYAVGGDGKSGIILRTSDSGANWSLAYRADTPGAIDCAFRSVYFTDTDTGYAVGAYLGLIIPYTGLFRKTVDGGATWVEQSSFSGAFCRSVYFINPSNGYVVGNDVNYGQFLKSTDGGTTWAYNIYEMPGYYSSVFFHNLDTGWIAGFKRNWPGDDYSVVIKTTDAGNSWTEKDVSMQGGMQLNSIFFTDVNTGYGVGTGGGNKQIIVKTTNGGNNWDEKTYSPGELKSVCFANALTGFAVGINGSIMKTTNAGNGINDFSKSAGTLLISPNPAFDFITIKTETRGTLAIMDISGHQILPAEITGPNTSIDISNLAEGIYFVKLTGDRVVQTGRFIKQ